MFWLKLFRSLKPWKNELTPNIINTKKNINKILYLHLDAQGTDLEILKSLKDQLLLIHVRLYLVK